MISDQYSKTIGLGQIFLVDGLGALWSAAMLFAVLRPLHVHIGFPPQVLLWLAVIPVFYAFYSLCCHRWAGKLWRPLLRGIAIANSLYMALTIALMIIYRADITAWGLAYFFAEIVVVSALVFVEWKRSRQPGTLA